MIVDAAVHPLMPDDEYRARLAPPWRDHMNLVPRAFGKLHATEAPEVADPDAAADPDALAGLVLAQAAAAVLTPLTRGLLPNPQHHAAVVAATNEWLHERFLSGAQPFFGAIRVPVTDPVAAVREIERWAGEPRFVQVAVPLRGRDQYGDARFWPVWEAAAAHDLPVYVVDDRATGAELLRSPVGQPQSSAEEDALRPMLSLVHLSNLVASGIFDRLPSLQLIFGDGGIDQVAPLLWRLDKDWRSGRVELPWLTEPPSVVARRHAGFVAQPADGTVDGLTPVPEVARANGAADLVLYGSGLPHRDAVDPHTATAAVPAEAHGDVLAGNALRRLPRLARALRPAAMA